MDHERSIETKRYYSEKVSIILFSLVFCGIIFLVSTSNIYFVSIYTVSSCYLSITSYHSLIEFFVKRRKLIDKVNNEIDIYLEEQINRQIEYER